MSKVILSGERFEAVLHDYSLDVLAISNAVWVWLSWCVSAWSRLYLE